MALGGSGVREWEGYAEPGCVCVLCLVDKEGRSVVFVFVFFVCVSGFVIFGFQFCVLRSGFMFLLFLSKPPLDLN